MTKLVAEMSDWSASPYRFAPSAPCPHSPGSSASPSGANASVIRCQAKPTIGNGAETGGCQGSSPKSLRRPTSSLPLQGLDYVVKTIHIAPGLERHMAETSGAGVPTSPGNRLLSSPGPEDFDSSASSRRFDRGLTDGRVRGGRSGCCCGSLPIHANL